MEWLTTNPEKPGRYIVETISYFWTNMLTRSKNHRLEAYWNGKSWNFTNQTFVKYLKE